MTRTEDTIQRSMVEWLETCGLKAGTPDLIFCIDGRFVGIEVKPLGKYLSPVQRGVHSAIQMSKGITYTVRSIDDLEGFLKGLGVPMRGRLAA